MLKYSHKGDITHGKLSKRNILWIVPIGILAVFWYFYGPQKDITDNEYITYVKTIPMKIAQKLWRVPLPLPENPYWVYFETQRDRML